MIAEILDKNPNNIVFEIYAKQIYSKLKRNTFIYTNINSLSIKHKCADGIAKWFSFIKQDNFPIITRLSLTAHLLIVPRNICRLSTLIVLNLNNNNIATIPPSIKLLFSLERLYLCNNNITTIPGDLHQLRNLTSLQLSDNKIINFPHNLDKFPYIQALSLSGNLLSDVHPSLFRSTSLSELDLSHNNIYLFNGSLIATMKYLDLSNNKLSQISANIYAMTQLYELDISNNGITNVSSAIDSLSKLKLLNLSDNYLHELPREICDLQALESLDLCNNALLELPDNFGDFLNIRHINLSNNALQELPLSIINLHNVVINIEGNDEIDLDYRIAAFLYPELEEDVDVVPAGNIYLNTENVHASSIHSSIKQSITALLTDPCPTMTKEELFHSIYGSGIFSDEVMNEINDDINGDAILTACNVSYYDILSRVWARIIANINPGIYARLAQEVVDGSGLCFVGKISRIVNSLSGFYPDINVIISDNESAGCITRQIVARRQPGEDDAHILSLIKTTLEERGFSNEIITAWTTGIF
jgi:Leucine-rich repeat (LRR) protein